MLAGLALVLAACAAGPIAPVPGSTLILIRHADRSGDLLNSRGSARARALPTALSDHDLAAIYLPDIARNHQSAAPLADATGLTPQVLPADPPPTAALLRLGAGRTVLWVGNSGNLKAIWQDLSLPGAPPVNYGDIAVIKVLADGRLSVERGRF